MTRTPTPNCMQEIMLFGPLTDVTGTDRLQIEPQPDTASVLEQLLTLYPALGNYYFTLAVDDTIVSENQRLSEASRIALLPPFSGG